MGLGALRVHGKALSNERSFLVRTDGEGEGGGFTHRCRL